MPNEREMMRSAAQWMPPEDKLDEDCTLLELWSRFHNEIADYRNFQNKNRTIAEYTTALKSIEKALKELRATQMTAFDCLEAVKSVSVYERNGNVREYGESALGKRFSAIRDIFQYCENRFICADPLWKAPWDSLSKPRDNWFRSREEIIDDLREDALRKTPKLQYITTLTERRIVRKAVENLKGPVDQRDGRWMGMLCYLYLGIRPSEGRGLRFRDFRPFGSHPQSWYCNICRTATETGEYKAKGKTKNYIRRVPVHPELHSILEMYKSELNKQLGCSEKELDDLPVICVGTKYQEPCSSLQLMRFVKGQLGDIVGEDELETLFMLSYTDEPTEEIHESSADESANRDVSTRIFRRNFITKAYAETPLEEDEIRAIVGHRQDRVKVDYSEETVYSWLKSISHRLICPEYHADMDTTIDDTKSQHQISAGVHKVTLVKEIGGDGLRLEITMLGESVGGDLQITVQGGIPQELKVIKSEQSYFSSVREDRGGRIVTDCAHWLLEHFE